MKKQLETAPEETLNIPVTPKQLLLPAGKKQEVAIPEDYSSLSKQDAARAAQQEFNNISEFYK